jgi:hypothetical protein
MSSVASSPPKQGQIINVRSHNWMVTDVSANTLPPDRLQIGEQITVATAKEIVAEAKKKRRPRRQKPVATDKLALRLVRALERYKERWKPR